MKKIKKLALAVSSMFLLQLVGTAVDANAQTLAAPAAPTITYEVSGTPAVGSTFTINVNASNVTDLYGASIDLTNVPAGFAVTKIAAGSEFASANQAVTNSTSSAAWTKVGNVSGTTSTSDVTLFTITAKNTTAGSWTLNSSTANVKLANSNATALNPTITPKTITVGSIIDDNDDKKIFDSLPTLTTGKFEDTNAGIYYLGDWTKSGDVNNSGLTMHYSSKKDNAFYFKFKGTGFKWVGQHSAARGQAKVYVDGVQVKAVDQYATSTKYQTVSYESTGLTDTVHEVKVVVNGTKAAASVAAHVSVDYIQVYGDAIVLGKGVYNDTNSALDYKGTWNFSYDARNSGATMYYSNVKGSTIEFKFSGTAFQIYGQHSAARGQAKVYVDGVQVGTFDQYASSTKFKQLSFAKSGLSNGTHTVKIEVAGAKQAAAMASHVSLDYIVVQ